MHPVVLDAAENLKEDGCRLSNNQSRYSVFAGPMCWRRENTVADSRESSSVQGLLNRPLGLFDSSYAAVLVLHKTTPAAHQVDDVATVHCFKHGYDSKCRHTAYDQTNNLADRLSNFRQIR